MGMGELGFGAPGKMVIPRFSFSNNWWKNNWFIIASEWGQFMPEDARKRLARGVVPKHFVSSDTWSKIPSVIDTKEVDCLGKAVTLKLE